MNCARRAVRMSADSNSDPIDSILSPDELTRVWGMITLLTAAEANARAMTLMLRGLQAKYRFMESERDLIAATDVLEAVSTRYANAIDRAFGVLMKRKEEEGAAEAVTATLH